MKTKVLVATRSLPLNSRSAAKEWTAMKISKTSKRTVLAIIIFLLAEAASAT